jgi:transposase
LKNFGNWRAQLKRERAGLPVNIADEAVAGDVPGGTSGAPPSLIIERPVPGIEIELIGGRRVRFDREVDRETLKRVVAALKAAAP